MNKILRLSRPARIALGYLAVATAWIVASDGMVAFLASDPDTFTRIQTWKGTGFVLTTGLALYALLPAMPSRPESPTAEPAAAQPPPTPF